MIDAKQSVGNHISILEFLSRFLFDDSDGFLGKSDLAMGWGWAEEEEAERQRRVDFDRRTGTEWFEGGTIQRLDMIW